VHTHHKLKQAVCQDGISLIEKELLMLSYERIPLSVKNSDAATTCYLFALVVRTSWRFSHETVFKRIRQHS
jgi:hypothetical protein